MHKKFQAFNPSCYRCWYCGLGSLSLRAGIGLTVAKPYFITQMGASILIPYTLAGEIACRNNKRNSIAFLGLDLSPVPSDIEQSDPKIMIKRMSVDKLIA